ncbi:hypothetical protein [Plasmodium yoelii yoelii]|uniref:Uncharacterized protein n=1 Tax=Plasmodium yoelii yoelii TaxID=73239 RepID=Q7REM6_PLAYO|nr:hypothetical protein [Plasmodium yoelii yoelii]
MKYYIYVCAIIIFFFLCGRKHTIMYAYDYIFIQKKLKSKIIYELI